MESSLPTNVQQILDVVTQLLIIVVPVIISWYIRTYVRGTAAEKDIAAIVRLANNAIDYAENLDKRGDLNLPPSFSKGKYKLKLAGEWLEKELQRANISITNEAAEQWISSEFQKRVGDVLMVGNLSQLAKTAVTIVREIEQNNLLNLPPEMDRVTYLVDLAADWLIVQAAEGGVDVTREDAMTWVRAEILQSLQIADESLPTNQQLEKLAQQALAFLVRLKESGKFSIQSGPAGGNMETDLALAWLLTETAKRGLSVTTDEIALALHTAVQQHE